MVSNHRPLPCQRLLGRCWRERRCKNAGTFADRESGQKALGATGGGWNHREPDARRFAGAAAARLVVVARTEPRGLEASRSSSSLVGSFASNRSKLLIGVLTACLPASYFWNALGPPPRSSPAARWLTPSFSRTWVTSCGPRTSSTSANSSQQPRPSRDAKVVALPRVGGLHDRHD